MVKYIKNFANRAAYTAYKDSQAYIEPHVSLIKSEEAVQYNDPVSRMKKVPLTFEITSGSAVYIKRMNGKTLYGSLNGGEWTDLTSRGYMELNDGDVLQFKCDSDTGYPSTDDWALLEATGDNRNSFRYNLKGNLFSLVDADNFENLTTYDTGTFSGLFQGSNVVDASQLVLPATTIGESIYNYLFYRCPYLVSGPAKLPATIVPQRAYYAMFRECTSLLDAPKISATTFNGQECCRDMFYGCTSLEVAPELLATNFEIGKGYTFMSMFYGCTSLTTPPSVLPATTITYGTYMYMFQNCSSMTTAPVILATDLTDAHSCCYAMFSGCSSLNYIKAMFTIVPYDTNMLNSWVNGVAENGTFVKNAAAQWNYTGVNGVPTGWTVTTATE